MNSRKKSLLKPLDKVREAPPLDRIKELERQVAELKKDVAMLKGLSGFPFAAEKNNSNEEKKKPGPIEKIDDVDLLHRRDALILLLEPVWPWLEGHLGGTAEDTRAALEAVAEAPETRSDWQQRLLQNTGSLLEFLRDERSGKTLPKATVIDALNLPLQNERRKRAANQLPTRKIAVPCRNLLDRF